MNKETSGSDRAMSRRQFIGAGVATTVALTAGRAVGAEPSAGEPTRDSGLLPYNPRTHRAMPTRNLGRTGFRTGIFSLGCQAAIEKKGNADQAVEIIHRALDLGVNYLDTSHVYGGGASETHVGLVMRERRKEAFLATKTGRRDREGALEEFAISLERLQTDHVDLYQLHNVQTMEQLDQIFAPDGAIHAFEQLKKEGRTLFVGITGHFEPNVLREAINRYPFDCILMAMNAADRHYLSFIEHLLPFALEKEMGIIGMKVATRGRVLSEWVPGPLEDQPERMRTARPGTLTMEEALRYNMSLPVSTNIVGVDNVEQLEENLATASGFTPLSPGEMAALEERTLPIVRQALYFRRWELGA
ncbi:MAG: aldo/keto reductase [Opitutaceae bacterium]